MQVLPQASSRQLDARISNVWPPDLGDESELSHPVMVMYHGSHRKLIQGPSNTGSTVSASVFFSALPHTHPQNAALALLPHPTHNLKKSIHSTNLPWSSHFTDEGTDHWLIRSQSPGWLLPSHSRLPGLDLRQSERRTLGPTPGHCPGSTREQPSRDGAQSLVT